MNSIIEQWDWYIREDFPMVYNEEREEENKINKANAKLIFSPKFIPFYPKLLSSGLNLAECLVFGFIDFYLHNPDDIFYFTNEQIWWLLWLWAQYISNCISELKKKWFINCKYKLRANGWKIRFIQKTQLYSDYNNSYNVDYNNSYSHTITKVIDNNNKIKENNINNINIWDLENKSNKINNKKILDDFEEFWKSYPKRKWKPEAKKAYINAIKNWATHIEIMGWLEKYKTEIKIKQTEDSYIKYPQWRLNWWRWQDDYVVDNVGKNPNFIPL